MTEQLTFDFLEIELPAEAEDEITLNSRKQFWERCFRAEEQYRTNPSKAIRDYWKGTRFEYSAFGFPYAWKPIHKIPELMDRTKLLR